jgi:hypothetical protein
MIETYLDHEEVWFGNKSFHLYQSFSELAHAVNYGGMNKEKHVFTGDCGDTLECSVSVIDNGVRLHTIVTTTGCCDQEQEVEEPYQLSLEQAEKFGYDLLSAVWESRDVSMKKSSEGRDVAGLEITAKEFSLTSSLR